MTLTEVVVSFAIIAIVAVIVVAGFATIGNINARANLQKNDDASLTLDIESDKNLQVGSPTTKHITSSNGYQMDININTYTTVDGRDSIRVFNYKS